MIKGVFFDAGNTVIFPDYDIYREIAVSLGVDVGVAAIIEAETHAREPFERAVAASRDNVMSYWDVFYGPFYRRVGLAEEKIPQAVEMTRRANETGLGIWKVPVGGLSETIEGMSARGLCTGIVSNSDGRLAERLEAMGIFGYFDFVIDSVVVGVSKPDPEIFNLALGRSSLEPHEAAFVGDYYEVDIVGAQEAGLRPILFDPCGAYPGADCDVVTRLPDVLALIDTWEESSR